MHGETTRIVIFVAFWTQPQALAAENCFPKSSDLSHEMCCSDGGLADCFTDDFTFEKCCPGLVGADPKLCFPKDGRFHEALCCSGEGLPLCFDWPFTWRSCCQSFWAKVNEPLTNLVQRHMVARASGVEWEHGDFFAEVVNAVGASGPCVELGVQRGNFSAAFLLGMSKRELPVPRYFMVDVWREEEHYDDDANIANEMQRDNLVAAATSVSTFWKYTTLVQLRTREAVALFKDEECAFIYVDARHDYCAVMEDLNLYWPKLRRGGVMAGDDFGSRNAHWIQCENGEFHPGGVKQAVIDFAVQMSSEQEEVVPYNMDDQWFIRKPVKSKGTRDLSSLQKYGLKGARLDTPPVSF